ncbi:MAG: hypothetical protein ACK5CA_03610, partial [Cyanobacteriota bacterium]
NNVNIDNFLQNINLNISPRKEFLCYQAPPFFLPISHNAKYEELILNRFSLLILFLLNIYHNMRIKEVCFILFTMNSYIIKKLAYLKGKIKNLILHQYF